MKSISLILISLLLALSAFAEKRKPNVIFIITDDQEKQQFGFLDESAYTPNIDRLANQGVYFTNTYATSTVCTPSRYTCMTGRYPSQGTSPKFLSDYTPEGSTRVDFNTYVEYDRPNIPKVMKSAGYRTGMIGKWHIGNLDFKELVPPPGSDPKDPEVAAMLKTNQERLAEAIKRHGFDYASRLYAGNSLDSHVLKNTGIVDHNWEWMVEGALEFIEESKDEPFYLYLSSTLSHWPPPEKSFHVDPRITAAGILDYDIDVQPSRADILRRQKEHGLTDKQAIALWIDDGIGAILDKLEALDLDEDTLIIYFNDHGMANNSKFSLYEGATHTQMMAYWPGQINARRSDKLVSSLDFAPTIFDACGITPPEELDMRGLSFLPLAKSEPVENWREYVYSELGHTRAITGYDWKYLAFRLPPSTQLSQEERDRIQIAYLDRLVEEYGWERPAFDPNARIPHTGGPPGGTLLDRNIFKANPPYLKNYYDPDQLYNLKNDPLETTNIAAQNPEKLATMQAALKKFLNELPGNFADLKE